MRFFLKAFVGHVATLFWFVSCISKLIHDLRGVNFIERKPVFLLRNVMLDNRYPKLITIGKDIWLTHGVIMLTHSWVSQYQMDNFQLKEKVAPVKIEQGAFIGANSIIFPGVTIWKGAYIAAGSVVTQNITAGVFAAGNPIEIKHYLK